MNFVDGGNATAKQSKMDVEAVSSFNLCFSEDVLSFSLFVQLSHFCGKKDQTTGSFFISAKPTVFGLLGSLAMCSFTSAVTQSFTSYELNIPYLLAHIVSQFKQRDASLGNCFILRFSRAYVGIIYKQTKGKFPREHHVV